MFRPAVALTVGLLSSRPMRRRWIGLAAIAAASLGAAGPVGVANAAGPQECGVPPVGISTLPAFATPAGGSLARTSRAGFSGLAETCTIRRSDGSVFGKAYVDDTGYTDTVEWMNARGEVVLALHRDREGVRPAWNASSRLLQRSTGLGCTITFDYRSEMMPSLSWRWNKTSFPVALRTTTTENNLIAAHNEWENNSDYCSIADNSILDFNYGGVTTADAGNHSDLISTIDHASLSGYGCATTDTACEITRYTPPIVAESDIRLNSSKTWANGAVAGAYDVQSIVAHESGHSAQFKHVSDTNQVMCNPCALTNNTDWRLLGKGDAMGNNEKY